MHAACPEHLVEALLEVTQPVVSSVRSCHAVSINCMYKCASSEVDLCTLQGQCSLSSMLSMHKKRLPDSGRRDHA